MKILLLEDDRIMQLIFENWLQGVEGRIVDCIIALEATPETPDVCITDLVLPDCRIDEVVPRTRARFPKTPILVVSGLGDPMTEAPGANAYLKKGDITQDALIASVMGLTR